jgi:hypothetical protein
MSATLEMAEEQPTYADPFSAVKRLLRNGKPIPARRRTRLDRLLQETLEASGCLNELLLWPNTNLTISHDVCV